MSTASVLYASSSCGSLVNAPEQQLLPAQAVDISFQNGIAAIHSTPSQAINDSQQLREELQTAKAEVAHLTSQLHQSRQAATNLSQRLAVAQITRREV